MAYFLDLFSPETYEAFARSDRSVSGFRERHRGIAGRVKPGDKFLCYMTKLSRWVGILEVVQGPYEDSSPLFSQDKDPFVVRFLVRPTVWLAVDKGVPIHEDAVWNALSFTSGQSKSSSTWTGKLRGSLVQFSDQDGAFLDALITSQAVDGKVYPVDADEYRGLAGHRIRRADKDVSVIVPDDRETSKDAIAPPPDEARESIKVQALLAEIGSRMGMQIWIPRSDRSAVLGEWRSDHQAILDRLPSTTTTVP